MGHGLWVVGGHGGNTSISFGDDYASQMPSSGHKLSFFYSLYGSFDSKPYIQGQRKGQNDHK